jgi:hypothetical protein
MKYLRKTASCIVLAYDSFGGQSGWTQRKEPKHGPRYSEYVAEQGADAAFLSGYRALLPDAVYLPFLCSIAAWCRWQIHGIYLDYPKNVPLRYHQGVRIVAAQLDRSNAKLGI